MRSSSSSATSVAPPFPILGPSGSATTKKLADTHEYRRSSVSFRGFAFGAHAKGRHAKGGATTHTHVLARRQPLRLQLPPESLRLRVVCRRQHDGVPEDRRRRSTAVPRLIRCAVVAAIRCGASARTTARKHRSIRRRVRRVDLRQRRHLLSAGRSLGGCD